MEKNEMGEGKEAFCIIYDEIKRLKQEEANLKHLNLVAIEKAKQEFMEAMSLEDVVELVYKKCPSHGEMTAFIIMLRQGVMGLNDIKIAHEKSKLFANIEDCNSMSGSSLGKRMRHMIEGLDEIFSLAVHPDSQDGADISDEEYELLNTFLIQIGFALADHTKMIDNKYRKGKRND